MLSISSAINGFSHRGFELTLEMQWEGAQNVDWVCAHVHLLQIKGGFLTLQMHRSQTEKDKISVTLLQKIRNVLGTRTGEGNGTKVDCNPAKSVSAAVSGSHGFS